MIDIKLFEDAITNQCKDLRAAGINPTMFWAYRKTKEIGNDLLDFNEVIWERDVEEIVSTCRANGIEEITISSTMSSIIKTLALFEKVGCKIDGLTKVKSSHKDWVTGEVQLYDAIKMTV
jgi:hypothetical protein